MRSWEWRSDDYCEYYRDVGDDGDTDDASDGDNDYVGDDASDDDNDDVGYGDAVKMRLMIMTTMKMTMKA